MPHSSAPVTRVDLYAYIHKALRTMMTDTLYAVGRVDVHDSAELHAACERVLALADACASHLAHENAFVHPAMEACHPGSSAHVSHEHEEHLHAIAQLCEAATTLGAANAGPARVQAAQALYRQLAVFVAENFLHMQIEETEHNHVLQTGYSDAELMALEGRILASIPPEENLAALRWMVPALTPAERAHLLGGMQAGAPAPVFAAALDAVRPHLSQRDWVKLEEALIPAAVTA